LKQLSGALSRIWLVLKFQMKWWTNSRISFSHRLSYSLSCVFQLPWRGTVSYFGKPFSSDNPLALLLLPEYANLLSKIDQKTDSITGKNLRILDIGANVGQFAATAQRLLSATVTSVEPNPICWPYLKKMAQVLTIGRSFGGQFLVIHRK